MSCILDAFLPEVLAMPWSFVFCRLVLIEINARHVICMMGVRVVVDKF